MRQIVITGVTRGLGRAMLEGFADRGHTVFGCGTNQTLIDELQDKYGSPHQFRKVDVADDAEVGAWARDILDLTTPDLVINNAALMNRNVPLWEVPPEEFTALLHVNVAGTYHVIRHLLPAMMAAGTGVIVNFSSGWGRATSPQVAPYCASKWAIEGLSRSLAQELPRGLAVVALNPGIIHTDMLGTCFGSSAGSFPSPHEWAQRAVPYLLSLNRSDSGCSVDVPS